MKDLSILGQVALCYSPFIDRNRAVLATRLADEALAQVASSLPEAELHPVAQAVTAGPLPAPSPLRSRR